VIRDLIRECDALILDRHGSLTVAEDLWQAYYKLEKVEHTAQISLIARQLGHVKILPRDEVQRLLEIREQLGIQGRILSCVACGACTGGI
jgi:L-fuculose-phosphate aldolase